VPSYLCTVQLTFGAKTVGEDQRMRKCSTANEGLKLSDVRFSTPRKENQDMRDSGLRCTCITVCLGAPVESRAVRRGADPGATKWPRNLCLLQAGVAPPLPACPSSGARGNPTHAWSTEPHL
jgi:hypothetical protein